MTTAGLDIGGANLKGVRAGGTACSVPFALWKAPERLPAALRAVLQCVQPFDALAATMTGELCDCFESRAQGVRRILAALGEALREVAPAAEVAVWRLDGAFVPLDEAARRPELVGAANWLALATWAAALYAPRSGLLVDVGSTTTDIVALCDGRPAPLGRSDVERLQSGELVYTGTWRTPVCALARRLPYRGAPTRVAAEVFATTADVYLLLGAIAEAPERFDTADGREATRERAAARLARQICCDPESLDEEGARALARAAAARQERLATRALGEVLAATGIEPEVAVVAGSGEFLARRIALAARPGRIVSLATELGPAVSRAACAWAVAALLDGRGGQHT